MGSSATGSARRPHLDFGYDPLGNLTSVADPKGNPTATAGDYTTKYTYDALSKSTEFG